VINLDELFPSDPDLVRQIEPDPSFWLDPIGRGSPDRSDHQTSCRTESRTLRSFESVPTFPIPFSQWVETCFHVRPFRTASTVVAGTESIRAIRRAPNLFGT